MTHPIAAASQVTFGPWPLILSHEDSISMRALVETCRASPGGDTWEPAPTQRALSALCAAPLMPASTWYSSETQFAYTPHDTHAFARYATSANKAALSCAVPLQMALLGTCSLAELTSAMQRARAMAFLVLHEAAPTPPVVPTEVVAYWIDALGVWIRSLNLLNASAPPQRAIAETLRDVRCLLVHARDRGHAEYPMLVAGLVQLERVVYAAYLSAHLCHAEQATRTESDPHMFTHWRACIERDARALSAWKKTSPAAPWVASQQPQQRTVPYTRPPEWFTAARDWRPRAMLQKALGACDVATLASPWSACLALCSAARLVDEAQVAQWVEMAALLGPNVYNATHDPDHAWLSTREFAARESSPTLCVHAVARGEPIGDAQLGRATSELVRKLCAPPSVDALLMMEK